jgi:hypothetical protein
MRRKRGEERFRFARAAADELLLFVAVLFLLAVPFRDDVERLVDDGIED